MCSNMQLINITWKLHKVALAAGGQMKVLCLFVDCRFIEHRQMSVLRFCIYDLNC